MVSAVLAIRGGDVLDTRRRRSARTPFHTVASNLADPQPVPGVWLGANDAYSRDTSCGIGCNMCKTGRLLSPGSPLLLRSRPPYQ
jgi:hypothetical protein